MSRGDVAVILPAGGIGARMGQMPCGPKQLIPINGRSILAHTIAGMRLVTRVQLIVVVTSEQLLDRVCADVNNLLNEDDLPCAAGPPEARLLCEESDGRTSLKGAASVEVICRPASAIDSRHSSIAHGVEHLRNRGYLFVIVHDAVRPVIPIKLIEELLCAAEEYGAAGFWVPLVSTVLRIDANGLVEDTIPRYTDEKGRLYVNSEMPQIFKYPILAKAYSLCDEHQLLHGTECLELVRRYCGVRAKMLKGDPDLLWKVTRPSDIILAESKLKPPKQKPLP
ncbi:D-ribitol-5-phosphate cytidylyltransferase-like isoform X2 [Varroa jacobsoni]|uniref:2-C-methyl-D-erythritol 4-phosphate cytidylyltransferase n=1 Tax=Varroa destructor TaxID=109461 RepID=A0A7M7JDK3_VARDE|nr:D-ribitol-5-phosphate cytidylyltransferase-like isoform X2 [Varroa destructor]XP_022704379.1 D-ribitol-5-phosphate cytidylyltransferase-like isoform X2 [Varroa jacobsoni]